MPTTPLSSVVEQQCYILKAVSSNLTEATMQISSGVERFLHTEEVEGSKPSSATIKRV